MRKHLLKLLINLRRYGALLSNQFKRRRLQLASVVLLAALLMVTLPMLWRGWLTLYYGQYIYPTSTVETTPVAIVFGARIYPDGRLSAMLQDRVDTAVMLYHAGKVRKILMSGDNRFDYYNEPGAMINYALTQGVPPEALQPDYAGRRTYDTCYRAKAVFQLESAVLVTQDFHLPRALFTCRNLGLEVVGVSADRRIYARRSITWSNLREIPASLLALFDVWRGHPAPVLGEPIPLKLGLRHGSN